MAGHVAAFAYHDVTNDPSDSGFQRPGAAPYKLTRAAFARHLDALGRAARPPEIVTALDMSAPGRHLLLTFDDGGRSATYIGDELSRRGWRGHFFIITARIGDPTFLDVPGIRYLAQCGHLIGSHSHTHPNVFREQTIPQMVAQWRMSCDRLSQVLGRPCVVGSVPGGDISPAVLHSAAAAGLQYLFTSEPVVAPQRVQDCWVVGRFCPKVATGAARVGELASFRGWERALLVRRLKGLARTMLPGPYRRLVQRRTQERSGTAPAV